MAKKIIIGVREGGGPPPGFQWSVWILGVALGEAMSAFNPIQYAHLAMQFQELAREEIPSHSATNSIDKIEDFYELRDKGGVLGPINARVFFGIDKEK